MRKLAICRWKSLKPFNKYLVWTHHTLKIQINDKSWKNCVTNFNISSQLAIANLDSIFSRYPASSKKLRWIQSIKCLWQNLEMMNIFCLTTNSNWRRFWGSLNLISIYTYKKMLEFEAWSWKQYPLNCCIAKSQKETKIYFFINKILILKMIEPL